MTPSNNLANTSSLDSSRNELIKDIESHIEIIYECLDELSESTSSANQTTSDVSPMKCESVEPSTSAESTENQEKTANDKPENDQEEEKEMKIDEAQNESKTE